MDGQSLTSNLSAMASSTGPARQPRRSGRDSAEPQPGPARAPTRRRATRPEPLADVHRGAPDVVLVGCGALAAQCFVPALSALQQTGALNVRAVVDPAEGAREWCRRTFPQALALASLDAVVAPPDALAIITTPPRFHPGQANTAFKRGWHVLCANPLATSAREAALMIASAQRHERILAIDFSRRFFPATRYLRTLCHDHLLGPPISFRIHEGTTRTIPENAPPVPDKFEPPDAVLQELGIVTLDLLTWFLGSASLVNYADDAMGGVEANAFIELSFAEGARGTVHLSREWPTEQSYTFVFERGIVRWNAAHPAHLTFQLGSAPSAIDGQLVAPLSPNHSFSNAVLPTPPEHARIAEVQHLLGVLAGRETLRVSATEAMHSLSMVEECYARRTSLPQPWLPRNEAAQAGAFAPPMIPRRP